MVHWCDFGLIVAMISDLLTNDGYTRLTMIDVMFAMAVTDGCEEWSFSLIVSVWITMSWDLRQWLFVEVMGDGWQCWLWWMVSQKQRNKNMQKLPTVMVLHQGWAATDKVPSTWATTCGELTGKKSWQQCQSEAKRWSQKLYSQEQTGPASWKECTFPIASFASCHRIFWSEDIAVEQVARVLPRAWSVPSC